MSAPLILWFRRDLRLTDNPALAAACASGRPLVALYILDDSDTAQSGAASRWWLHHGLSAIDCELSRLGGCLVLRRGHPAEILETLIAESGAEAVYWNRCYEPHAVARDRTIKTALMARGLDVRSFNASLLFEPTAIARKSGEPYKVFTPFWRACRAIEEPEPPQPAPRAIRWAASVTGDALESWALLPMAPDWAAGLRAAWVPGEAGARQRLADFVGRLASYADERDRPDREATSALSPHLHFGEIGPRQVWHAVRSAGDHDAAAEKFLAELGWREFHHHLLFHVPESATHNLRREFDRFPWSSDARALRAWQHGRTGYPIVDAGMRQLWQSGWVHNRVRMITASFLVKHLMLRWQEGAAWFWDTLVDADLASNSGGWQWVAGSGADAAPYFRIFNPMLQGEKFDPDGTYVRRFVPELARLPARFIHQPWNAPAETLAEAGIELGRTYPHPIVDHGAARQRALQAFAGIRQAA
jgi:deoxyribodipyrimidine photo-lyase